MKKTKDNYIRNPKGRIERGKWEPGSDDFEDYEQESRIKEWLRNEGRTDEIDLKYINSKGNARCDFVKATIRLDQQIRNESGSATYADLIAGSDGRDLECRVGDNESDYSAEDKMEIYLTCLGFNKGEVKWLIKIFKLSIRGNMKLLPTSQTDSESWTQFEPFKE